jgi:protein-S-isoprenylcysteine O-methyltransferase Ste14
MTVTLVLAYIAACAAFAVEEFVLIAPVSTVAQSDAASRRVELLAIWVPALGMAVCGATMVRYGGVRLGGLVNGLGLALSVAGLALRYWSRRVLGRFFTIGVVRQEGHEVVRRGPYRHIRHPGYLGFILFYTGLPLLVGSWLGAVVLTLPSVVVFAVLVSIEDRRLEEELGGQYAQYKRESARLVPGLW